MPIYENKLVNTIERNFTMKIFNILMLILTLINVTGCGESKREKAREACMKSIGHKISSSVDQIRLQECIKRVEPHM